MAKRFFVTVNANGKDQLTAQGNYKHVYTGSSPSAAAKKAINAKGKNKPGKIVEVRLRERNENQHKILIYKGKCVKIDAPDHFKQMGIKKVCVAKITSKKIVTR